eukprot:1338418-Pleurochrysis_carterae.AAC.1
MSPPYHRLQWVRLTFPLTRRSRGRVGAVRYLPSLARGERGKATPSRSRVASPILIARGTSRQASRRDPAMIR